MEGFLEQLEEIENETIRENILPIANTLEQYIGSEIEISESLLDVLYDELNHENIRSNINQIRKLALNDDNSVIVSLTQSLSTNRADFIRMKDNADFNTRKKKSIKIFYSYVNLSRALVNYDDYKNLLKNVPSNKKILLILGTVDPGNDDILVLKEIDEILKKSNLKRIYTVIPIYGCNTDQFREFTKRYDVEIVHFSGHGDRHDNGNYVVCFVDSNMRYGTIKKYIGRGKTLVFFNCCYSYELVDRQAKCGDYMIAHEGEVSCDVALDYSSFFYDEFSKSSHIKYSYNEAQRNINFSDRYKLI